ncbi:hypothetical protein [Bradyrhizobium sp. SZCCHNR2032]|uniref:hypothetical protein n=1 Tax=Bradyrhizobium sp. SZCCHNR2032 TaxID=3057384 RepID=UPI002915FD3E|nr:hypothetical protein [Bradyrhizobium sp. SZCCHNR2032]
MIALTGTRSIRLVGPSLTVRLLLRASRLAAALLLLVCSVALLVYFGSKAIAASPEHAFVGAWQISLTQTSADFVEEGIDDSLRRSKIIQQFTISQVGDTYSIDGIEQISDLQFNDRELSFMASDDSLSEVNTECYFRVESSGQISGESLERGASLESLNANRNGTPLGMCVADNKSPIVRKAVPSARPSDTTGALRAELQTCSNDCTRSWIACGRACGFGPSEGRSTCNATCQLEYTRCKSSC